MAVKDVFAPKPVDQVDPTGVAKEKADEGPEYWDKKAKAARSKREFEEEEEKTRRIAEARENPPEAPFTVKGSVDLGHFDLQAQQAELKASIDKIQNEHKAQVAALSQENEHYREELHKLELEKMDKITSAKIDSLEKLITEGNLKPKDSNIMEQVNQIEKLAGLLGYIKPAASEGLDPQVRLKLAEMDLTGKREARKYEFDKIISEREFKLKEKISEQEYSLNVAKFNAEIEAEKKKRDMWISPFESIGTAIARGLIDSGGTIPGVGQNPVSKEPKKSLHKLEAAEGESGVVDCPECGQPVAIAPTARSAVCANCEARVSITRKAKAGENA